MLTAAQQPKVKGPRRKIEATCDLTDPNLKRRLCAAIGSLSGWYELSIVPRRDTRSLRANAFYWAAVIRPFYDFLREQDAEIGSMDDAHALCKEKFLRVPVVNKATGEMIGYRTRSTTELNTAEFCDYVERVRHWLFDMFGIVTLDPEER